MANIKSAKKRILVNETKAARNKAIRSKVKTAIKKVDAAVAAGDKAAAQAALLAATTEIDKLLPREYITRIMLPARYPAYPRLLIPSLNL